MATLIIVHGIPEQVSKPIRFFFFKRRYSGLESNFPDRDVWFRVVAVRLAVVRWFEPFLCLLDLLASTFMRQCYWFKLRKMPFSFLTLSQLKHVREPLAYCTSHADQRHGTLFMGRGCNISLLIFKGIWEMHSLGVGLGCGRRGNTSHAVTWSEVLVELTEAQWPTWGRMATLSPTHIRSDGSWPCQWFIAVQLQMNIAPSCPTVYRSCTG